MFGKDCYREINEGLNRAFEKNKVLIASHRGAWGGNIVENTIPSFELALEMGADMFECDVSKSTDGVLYSFHDGGEKRKLGVDKNIELLSSSEINELIFINSIGLPSGVKVALFESIVAHFKDGELYNVDRSWTKFPETIAVLQKYPWALKQALIKTPVMDDVLEFLNRWPNKFMYMPIVRSMEEVNKALSYGDVNLVGMEIIAETQEDELFSDDTIKYLHDKGVFAWVNSLTLSSLSRHILYGGLDDDMALLKSSDESWGRILKKGADIVQTDWPVQFKKYREAFFNRA